MPISIIYIELVWYSKHMHVYQTKYDKHIMWLDLGHKCFEMLQWFSRFQRTFETKTVSCSKNWEKIAF